jgi:outer membrane protein OmpA-like peptidoglycan-associated protein
MKRLTLMLFVFFDFIAGAQTPDMAKVYFEFDKYDLSNAAQKTLDSLVVLTKATNAPAKFSITGHCDNRGTNPYNDILADKRAKVVQQYLIGKGVSAENFVLVRSAGETEPLNQNITDEERQLNRRVTIAVFKDKAESTSDTKTIKDMIVDSTITTGSNIILQNINFYGGSHEFLPESEPMLKELLEAMIAYPSLVIRIEGHICCEESEIDGTDISTGLRNLSSTRANAVRQYLINNAIDAKRLSSIGYGHSRPLFPYPEQNDEERRLNRRVEVKILAK